MAYSKLHSSIVHSSLWTEPDHVRLLFITLLAMCDKEGCVYGSRGGLERAAMIDPNACDEMNPWEVLLSPDPDSSDKMRAPEHEGRRIVEIPGGFQLLNFAYYRGLRNDDDRAEQNRRAQAKWRVSHGKPSSATVSHGKPPKAHTEAEADAEASPPHPPAGSASDCSRCPKDGDDAGFDLEAKKPCSCKRGRARAARYARAAADDAGQKKPRRAAETGGGPRPLKEMLESFKSRGAP